MQIAPYQAEVWRCQSIGFHEKFMALDADTKRGMGTGLELLTWQMNYRGGFAGLFVASIELPVVRGATRKLMLFLFSSKNWSSSRIHLMYGASHLGF